MSLRQLSDISKLGGRLHLLGKICFRMASTRGKSHKVGRCHQSSRQHKHNQWGPRYTTSAILCSSRVPPPFLLEQRLIPRTCVHSDRPGSLETCACWNTPPTTRQSLYLQLYAAEASATESTRERPILDLVDTASLQDISPPSHYRGRPQKRPI